MEKSVKFTPATEDKVKTRLNLDLPKPLLRAMRMKSVQIEGCKRREGSMAHFARAAILYLLRDKFGVDFEKINPDVYKIPKIRLGRTC